MSQRNPMNERYTTDRQGQTRKSAASAKPKSERAATLRDPAPKSRKQKKLERQEREAKMRKRAATTTARLRYEDTEEYKRLRRVWWGFLIAAIACTAIAFFMNSEADRFTFYINDIAISIGVLFMVCAYAFIIVAFILDFSRIRKGRNRFEARKLDDNSKEARAQQKQLRAEAREKEREEAERAKEAAENPAPTKKGIFGFLKRNKSTDQVAESETSEESTSTETK